MNYRSVTGGAAVQRTTTLLKVAGLLLVTGGALAYQTRPAVETVAPLPAWGLSEIGVAMIACLWAYNGWFQVGFVAGEIKDPRRNLPVSLGLGVGTVIALYMLANVAYLNVLSPDEIAATDRVAALVAERSFGSAGGTIVSLTILISILGALNAGILTGPRVYFAQAREGLFFQKFGEVSRFETPGLAVLLQGVWAAILSLIGSYHWLFSYVMFVAWIFYGLAVFGVIVLRVTRPELERPYRMWGYPVTPALFALASVWLVANTLVATPGPSLAGLFLIASGIPVYFGWRRLGTARSGKA